MFTNQEQSLPIRVAVVLQMMRRGFSPDADDFVTEDAELY